jgi:hypothetical protein
MPVYEHTQSGRWHYLLMAVAAVSLAAAWYMPDPTGRFALAAVAAAVVLVALMFMNLTVRDEGERLALRFGLLPLLRKSIAYADISAAEPDRSKVIDGWGIHWVLGRGWTYNIWGFDCVRLTVKGRTIRIGTDDRDALLAFLRGKCPALRSS